MVPCACHPAQLMSPGIGRNMSYTVGNFAQHLGLFILKGDVCGPLIVDALKSIDDFVSNYATGKTQFSLNHTPAFELGRV